MSDKMKKFLELHNNAAGGNSGSTASTKKAPVQSQTVKTTSTVNKKQKKVEEFQAMHDQANRTFSVTGRNDGSDDFVHSFLRDSQDYIRESVNAFQRMNWLDVMDTGKAETRSKVWENLRERGTQVRSFMETNKDEIDPDKYQQVMDYLDSFNSDLDSVSKGYKGYEDFFSQWESYSDYQDYENQQKDYEEKKNFDINAAQKEIDALELRRAEIMRSKRPVGSNYLVGGSTSGSSPYAAGFHESGIDKELEDLDTLISQKKQYLNQAKHIQEGIALASVADRESENYDFYFNTKSQYNTTIKGTSVGDTQYEWINNRNGFRDDYESRMAEQTLTDNLMTGGYGAPSESYYRQNGYDKMTSSEVAIYNYYYTTEGKEKAQEYLDSITESLRHRKATSMFEEELEGRTGLEMIFGAQAGLGQFKSGISSLFNSEDGYIPQSAVQMASGMVREDLADKGAKLPEWMGGASLGQVGYDAITTTANMAPSIMTSMAVGLINPVAGEIVGTGLMGASAAGNAYQEMLNLGYDKEQARMYSTLVGGAEASMQYLLGGIGKLGGTVSSNVLTKMMNGVDNAFLRTSLKLAGSMASEGLEEGVQEILTPWFQNLVMHTDEDVNWGEVAYSTLLGALTAGFMEGGSTVSGEVNTYKTGKQLQQADISAQRIADLGKTFSADTVAYQLAGRVNENTSAYTMGRLFNEIGATLTEQNVNDITEALVNKGMSREVAKANAEAMASVVEGGNLTDAQVKIIEANEVLAEAVRTTIIDPNATWFQRTKGYNEALMALAQEKASPNGSRTNPAQQDKENAPASDTVDTQNENGAEGGSEADIPAPKMKSISNIKDGRVTVKLEDGSEVDVREAGIDPEDGVLVETVAQIDGISSQDANFILGTLKASPGASAQMNALGAKEMYKYGFYGISQDHIAKHGVFANSLSETQRKAIYETGRKARQQQVDNKNATVAKKNATTEKSGKVHFEGDRNSLTERQSASLSAMEKVAEALGVQIHVFESKVGENGKRIGANGWYDPKDSSIHIDLHAGANGEGTMLFTAAHELTHHIRKWSPAKFKVLADFLMQEYGKKGVNVDALIREQMAKAKRNGRTISYDTAYEEVVADSMETMLSDGNVLEKLAKLKQKDQSLWQKIKDFISDLAVKIRKVYEGLSPDSVEGRYVAEMVDSIEKLQDLFTGALVEASENYQASLTPGEEGVVANQNGDPVAYSTEDGSVLLSMRTYEEDGRKAFRDYLQKCVSSNKLTKAEMQEMLDGIEDIYQICKEFKDKYAPFSSWSDAAVVRDTYGKPVFSVVTPNGDYKMNLDFSLVCKKRRTLDAVFNEMSRRGIIDDFELGQKSVVKINEIIRNHGLETACALCFVDAKRFRQASMADQFTNLYNELVMSLVPEDQKGSIDHFNFSGYETIKKVDSGIHTWNASKLDFSHLDEVMKNYGKGTVEHKAAKYIKSHPEGRRLLLRGDFMSSQGFDAVKTQNKDILKLYNSKKGTGGPKAAFGDVQYMNEIIKKARTWTPAKAYAVGGVRIQSFSDYVPRMVFDYVQMIYDLSATKLPAHAYTKEALFVKQFGLTGVKINMSLIPAIAEGGIAPGLDANGDYVWAGESFDYETAKEIQNAEGYTENCGTICVGVSKQHIEKLLRDPNIRMVIPYHKSGLNPIVAHMNKIAEFTDYTNDQRTKGKDGKALSKDFDFSKAMHDMGDKASPKAVADQYLKWCVANGYTAKFAEFAAEENYYKLLEDFTLYDKDGNYVPQREVKAVFPKEGSAFGSMKDLIQEGLEEDAVIEGKRDSSLSSIVDEIQKTLPRTEAEIAETQVKQADRDLEATRFSLREIVGPSGKNYGVGVYLDSTLLENLSEDERIAMVKEYIKEIGGSTFTAYDNNHKAVDIHLVESTRKFKNKSGKNVPVLKDMMNYLKTDVKQEAIALIDELILASTYRGTEPATHPHDWVDNNGANDWDVWTTYIQDKKNTVWEAKLRIANSANGEKILYDIFPINKVEEAQTMGTATTNGIVSQSNPGVNTEELYSDRDSDSVSNRSLLANAFEGVARNDIERSKIQEYKGKIDLINAEERKLSELNQKIKDLTFSKGPRDTKAIRELQLEAKQTANRISIYDKQLLRLEASKPLQDILNREKKMAYQRAEKKGKEALEAYREKATKTQKEMQTRYQESRKKGVENRHKTEMRHKIKNVVSELNQYLLKGNKDKRVMMPLQKAVAEALDAVNMDTVGAEERIAKLEAELVNAKTPEKIQEISRKIDRIREMGDNMSNRLKALKDAYREITDSDDPLIANAHDDVIGAKLESVIEKVGNTPLRDMNLEQLGEVYDMYRMVLTTIRNANKAFKAAKSESIADLGHRVMGEVEKVGGKKRYNLAAVEAIKKFGWNNLKPVYAFEHIGSKTFTEIFNNVRAGEDVWARDITEARTFYLEKSKKYGFDSWKMDQWHDFTSTSGMDFSLNLEQIMSLYAYSKREQAADHLRRGGIVIDESTEISMKTKLGLKVKFNPTEATAYNISNETLADIISKLTPEQKQFVDEMQEYLSTTMGNKGNEVSLEMYGVKLFKEKHYFPLKSASQFMAKAKEQQQGEVKIKNSGFSKETVKNASNPIVLTPFMNVWASHVNEMSMYHAFVLPMEDFYRVYNFRTPTYESMATQSVEMFIQNAYGKGATKYIDQLLKDLNGGARTDSTTGIINKGMGLFKKGAVFASASVVIQQPSAIARATALVDLKHFIGPKVDHKRHKALWEEVKQYAPVAIIKEMGYFDTNMGKSTEDFLVGKEYSGIKEKMTALVTDSDFRDEVLSKAPALADELTWCAIWEAVKRETRAKHSGMDTKSEAFLKLAGDRFTEVITKTQVYDSVLSRSANMRSKDTGMKMATAFMAEPTTSINMISDALLQSKRGNRKYARAAIGSVVASQILNAILVSFVYAGRDDDEEKSYAEKYISNLTGEILDGLNPATYIPFVKDIASIVQGYDVERSDMAVISDLWNAYQTLSSDDVSAYRKVEGFAGSICQIFGLPLKNIMKDVRAVFQTYDTIVNGEDTTVRGAAYSIKEAITGKSTSNPDQLYNARLHGDEKHVARVEERYAKKAPNAEEAEKSADAAVRQSIKDRYLAGEIDFSTATMQLTKHAGMKANEAYWLMDAWKHKKETGSDDGYSKYNDFYEAVQTGKNLKAVIKEYSDNGVKKTTLSGQITEHFKSEYVKMPASERARLKGYLINAYEQCGISREAAGEKLREWDFEAKYGGSYSEIVADYKNGTVDETTMRNILAEKGYSKSDIEDQISDWNVYKIYGYEYSKLDDAYRAGELSREEFRQAMIDNGTFPAKADQAIVTYDWMRDNAQYGLEYADAAKYAHPIENYGYSLSDVKLDPNTYLEYKELKKECKGVDDDNDGTADSGTLRASIFEMINDLPINADQKDALAAISYGMKSIKKYAPWH